MLSEIRKDPKTPLTRISDARISIKELSKEDINTLSNKLYKIKLPYRWRISNSSEYEETPLVSIISKDHEYPNISAVFYPRMIKSSSTRAENALKNFYKLIQKNSIAIDISLGDLVYIDNRFSLHSRDKFQPTFDKKNTPLRWVQRIFISESLWKHRNLKRVKNRIFSI
ncbi:TauD/TfdA family dioxygenase [Bartonella sp. cb54]|uniref:TauD/TfdA family dioxygenase n=1 Tax=Bartonella sp. cb54 TaxID=3385560 RepID=UPI0039A650CD